MSKHRVARWMREYGLRGRVVRVTRRQPGLKVFCRGVGNRLRELGKPTGLNQQWAGDLTYLKVGGKWRYLAVVLDLFSRKVIAWSLGENRPHELPGQALHYALSKRRPKPGLVFHSDGGIEYRSFAYQGQLADCGITSSMNRPGKCTDNAIVESFFHTSKQNSIVGEPSLQLRSYGAESSDILITSTIEKGCTPELAICHRNNLNSVSLNKIP